MGSFSSPLVDRIRAGHEDLMALARRRVDASGADFSDEELEQLLNGFEAMLLESLEERGQETRDLFLQTAIPAVVASGRVTADDVAGGAAAWGALLSVYLVAELDEEHRADAALWLADFFDDYGRGATRAALEAQR